MLEVSQESFCRRCRDRSNLCEPNIEGQKGEVTMIADIFYDRNPDAFAGVDDERHARVFHQISTLLFDDALPKIHDRVGLCEYTYKLLCKEIGVNQLMKMTRGADYFTESIGYIDACRIYIGEANHRHFPREDTSEFLRKKTSLIELILRCLTYTLEKEKRDELSVKIVKELNERLRIARFPYRYHAGVFQPADDDLSESEIETPFWTVIANSMWKSVDDEMKDAFDTRENDGVDPAFHAAKALESTIKIISDQKGWTTGNEKGAANYIDNLVSQKNGRFLEVWEGDLLKLFFSKVRNPMGHGKGNQADPALSSEQTDWVIDQCMTWIKCLTRRT